jgi:hypothetical protein
MANLPLRDLGAIGVITDANPYNLPPNALSRAVNVIFDENRVQRAPVFKQLFPAIKSALSFDSSEGTMDASTGFFDSAEGTPTTATRFVASYADPSFGETVIICDNDGEVRAYPNGQLSFTSPSTGTLTNEEPWSHAQTSGLSYLARKGMRPYVRNVRTDAAYTQIAGDWPSGASAAVVRDYLDFVLMLNVTKGSIEYPTMVKWSDPVSYSAPVGDVTWDPFNTSGIAGENILGDATSEIRDGRVLGTQFVIYTQDQVWLMEYTGSSLVFNFRRLFPDGGILNTNCVVEVDGKHYVFGDDDIYVHDGTSRQSIADQRVRRYVFAALNRDRRKVCFTLHDSVSNLIYFCYNTLQDEAGFKDTQFCNQAAVYNYRSNTWSFVDLPNVVGGAEANVDIQASLYPALSQGYDVYNTAYLSFEGQKPRITIGVGVTDLKNGLTESRVYAIDLPAAGIVNLPATVETVRPAFIERVGIDLDDEGLGMPLRSYKTILGVIPQASFNTTDGKFTWEFGSSDLPNGVVKYRTSSEFYPSLDYKIDTKVSGRYLAYKITSESLEDFRISGFDSEVVSTSRR